MHRRANRATYDERFLGANPDKYDVNPRMSRISRQRHFGLVAVQRSARMTADSWAEKENGAQAASRHPDRFPYKPARAFG
jgi:hypothetical protein